MLSDRVDVAPANYGAQRMRAGEPLGDTTRRVVQAPRLSHSVGQDGVYDPNSPPPSVDRRYGAQKRGPLHNSKGQVAEGPRRGKVRLGRGKMYFGGVRRSAKEALHLFPRLWMKLDGGKGLKQRTLENKVRTAYKSGSIPESDLVQYEASLGRNRSLRSGVVHHFLIENLDRSTGLLGFLDEMRDQVVG